MTTADDLAQQSMPLCATLGITTQEATRERVVLAMDWDKTLCTVADGLHGGALMALADSAGHQCLFESSRRRDGYVNHRIEDELSRGRAEWCRDGRLAAAPHRVDDDCGGNGSS